MADKRPILKRDFFKKKSNINYKYFLWAAIGLVILVVITPLVTHRRSDKTPSEKVTPEIGVVMKEIPRSTPAGPETAQPLPGTDSAAGIKEANLEPGASVSQDIQSEGQVNQPPAYAEGSPEGAAAISAGTQPEQAQTASVAEPQQVPAAPAKVPESTANQQTAASLTKDEAAMAPQETHPQGSAAPEQQASVLSQPKAPKPSEELTTGGGTKYIVQIGSFSQKKNADSIQQTLMKQGYDVIVRTTEHAKFGTLYVVQLSPVYDPNKAESLLARVRKEAKVNPMMVKIPAGQ